MTDNPALSSQARHPELVSGSISRFARSKRRQAQPHRQVPPLRVFGVDQTDLPLSVPALELLLAQDRPLHVAEHLEVHEPVNLVSGREPGKQTFAVLDQPLQQVRGNADVDCAVVLVREQVDARVPLFAHAPERAEKWTLKQVQGDEICSVFEVLRHAELVSASIVPQPMPLVTG